MNTPSMDNDTLVVWLTIAGVSLTTFITRGSFILLGSRLRLPAIVDRALGYAPACALAAILAPELAVMHGALQLNAGNPRLIAGFVAVICCAVSRSMVLTIVLGMATFTLTRIWLSI